MFDRKDRKQLERSKRKFFRKWNRNKNRNRNKLSVDSLELRTLDTLTTQKKK